MAEAVADTQPPLNDLMMAMDVVDTLRHGEALVERELSGDQRRSRMIERLREIYKAQGLEVSDRILEDGVAALEQERFVYKPKQGGFSFTLARLYIRRGKIGRRVGIIAAVVIAVFAAWYFLIQQPSQRADEALQIELSEAIPADLARLEAAIAQEANDPAVVAEAATIADDGLEAAELADADAARTAVAELETLLNELRLVFDVEIVNRSGTPSGVFRIPDANEAARNYYLIVEAVNESGNVISRTITSEESGDTRGVRTFGIRVPESVYNEALADFQDDGIIQNNLVGEKIRGDLDITWLVETPGGMILDW